MKKKITIVLAGLGLCASMMLFSAPEAEASWRAKTGRWKMGSMIGDDYASGVFYCDGSWFKNECSTGEVIFYC